MAIRHQHDDDDFAFRRYRPPPTLHGDDECGTPPRLADTLIELIATAAGFVGVILPIYAVLGAFRGSI